MTLRIKNQYTGEAIIIAGVIVVFCLAFIGFAVWVTQPTTVRGAALARLERLERLDRITDAEPETEADHG